jgi:DeoR family glycerol-3-phosphate regulon repressor
MPPTVSSMTSEDRRQAILDLVRRRGFVVVEALSRRFDVTSQTIRRDIKALCDEGELVRHHGGAGLPSSVVNTEYSARLISQLEEKEAIAKAVATHVPDNASVFMTIGTTMEVVARALTQRTGMKIITNNVHVASTLHPKPDFEVMIAGGMVRTHNGGVIGDAAIDFVTRFRVDYAIMGIGAIEADGALLDYDPNEVAIMRAMMRSARRVLIAADHTKFTKTSTVRVGSLADVSAVFTDRVPPKGISDLLAAHDVELHIAEVTPDGF